MLGGMPADSGKVMGGWYVAKGLYRCDELGGLPLARFCEALQAEGFPAHAGANMPLHLQAVTELDIYGDGRATVGKAAPAGSLPVSEPSNEFCCGVPWFKRHRPEIIDEYVLAVKKVVAHAEELRG